MSKPLAFAAFLRAADRDSKPPGWATNDREGARFYFDNQYGEQWIALVEKDRLTVSCSDVDWAEHVALDPEWDELWKSADMLSAALDLSLEPAEALWLRSVCLIGAVLHGKAL